MIPGRIPQATRYLGAPPDWVPEAHGPCAHLAIRDMIVNDSLPSMHSAWEPTPEELERLKAGASVVLCIIGVAHPPVSLFVGEAPEMSANG